MCTCTSVHCTLVKLYTSKAERKYLVHEYLVHESVTILDVKAGLKVAIQQLHAIQSSLNTVQLKSNTLCMDGEVCLGQNKLKL